MNDFSPDRMPEATAVSQAQQKLDAMKIAEHSRCLLCGKDNPIGSRHFHGGAILHALGSPVFPGSISARVGH